MVGWLIGNGGVISDGKRDGEWGGDGDGSGEVIMVSILWLVWKLVLRDLVGGIWNFG